MARLRKWFILNGVVFIMLFVEEDPRFALKAQGKVGAMRQGAGNPSSGATVA